jgi:ATP-dependent helicase HrpB
LPVASKLDTLAGQLPIAAILPAVLEVIGERNVVIEAPPGAGKTTIVPLTLLEHGTFGEGEILVLQPRRLAARLSAVRTAALLGERVGERVGYRVRFDHAGGRATKLWFLTEGVLLRRLRDDPELRGVAAVILDEFHERHLDGDLALALLRRLQLARAEAGATQLRLVAMSATLDAEPVARFLAAERLRTQGRSFPVEIEYHPPPTRREEPPLERRVASAVRELIERGLIGERAAEPGHALVFLPGAREIQACMESCAKLATRAGVELVALHGQLPRDQQDRAVEGGARSKLILSTNVAETSITIDGVVAVIDSGLARVADFDPGSGLPRLSLAPISRASATQRAGRAGRTRAGLCIRLYSRHDHDTRPEHQLPEVRRLELAGALLELAAAGVRDPEAFAWFEAPSTAALAVARELLISLGAISHEGELHPLGRAMLRFPLHPRLARLLIAGIEAGVLELAVRAAAILAERPLRRGSGPRRTTDADILDEIELMRGRGDRRGIDPGAAAAVERATAQLMRQAKRAARSADLDPGEPPPTRELREAALRRALLAAHPDRVATVRVDEHDRRTLVFAFGGSAELGRESGVRSSDWVVALRSEERREGTRRRAIVRSACAIDPEWLVDLFPEAITDEERIEFDAERERVRGESALRYGKLVIESSAMAKLPEDRAGEVLLAAARAAGAGRFCVPPKTKSRAKLSGPEALEQLRLRAAFVHAHREDFPELDEVLIDEVLARACVGRQSFAELEQAELLASLAAELGTRAGGHRALDRLAPASIVLPGGRRLQIHYEVDRPPWVGSRLQDFFGMSEGPRILVGEVPLVLHLRAPNRHDVAVSSDLAHFWREHYPQLRTRLSRRYPKHDWPEDPLAATPPHPGGRRRR